MKALGFGQFQALGFGHAAGSVLGVSASPRRFKHRSAWPSTLTRRKP